MSFGFSELVAALAGLLVAGGGRIASDWLTKNQTRAAYIASIKAETSTLCDIIKTQKLEASLRKIVESCENGTSPEHTPTYDFGQNYFSFYDNLGSDFKYLNEEECDVVVKFYILTKAAFDTVKKDGPISANTDRNILAQRCRFLLSLIPQIFQLNDRIQNFSAKRQFNPFL